MRGGCMRRLSWLLMLFLVWSLPAGAATLDEQRQWFQAADTALDHGDERTYRSLREKLNSYPLAPYLDIWHARKRLKDGHDAEAARLVSLYDDIPESINLRIAWMKVLAKRSHWHRLARMFAENPRDRRRLPEIYMVTLWRSNHKVEALQHFSERWSAGKHHAPMADRLYHLWRSEGHPTVSERWQRMAQLARRGKWKEIRTLAKPLPEAERQLVAYWRDMQRDPEKQLAVLPASMGADAAAVILQDGFKRYSRNDPEAAMTALRGLRETAIDEQLYHELERMIALRAARRHLPTAAAWLALLPSAFQNDETRAWQVRLHLLAGNWAMAEAGIAAMPKRQRAEDHWLYWRARSLDELDRRADAEPYYRRLAGERGYHSFLAAERLGLPPKLSAVAPHAEPEAFAELLNRPCVHRAYEWLKLGKPAKASREWHYGLDGAPTELWRAAMVLTEDWEWPNESIRAAFLGDQLDALEERFPLAYSDAVEAAAEDSGLSATEIWSVIRQESAFNAQAVSYVGARGLMQLMPATAKRVARQLKMKTRHPDLFSPEVNVRLGANYLAAQRERFGNLGLAAAAYNAGPRRVAEWLERTPYDRPEAWIEAIPFSETRRYVQRVLSYVTVYEWRQQWRPTSLIARVRDREQQLSVNSSPQKEGASAEKRL